MKLTNKTKERILIIIFVSSILLTISAILLYVNSYQTEQEILNNAYDSLNLQHPTYNETTRFFETYENKNIYIGYIEVNNTEISTANVKQFTNYTETLIIGNRVLYVSDNNTIIYQKNVNRRFN